MIRKANECTQSVRDAMRGGPGSVKMTELATKAELLDKGRLFSIIILEPNCGIGIHDHQEETEIFYIISGSALYTDDEKEVEVFPGDVCICEPGHKHGVVNCGSEACKMLATIILK